MYNTVVRLCQFFCCGGKLNFVQIFSLNDYLRKFLLVFSYFTETMRSKLSARLFLKYIENFLYNKMWIYNFTVTIVSQKISRTFFVQNLIPYKTYVWEKHVESILGTSKNMTKKVFNLNTYRLIVTIVSQKYRELSVQVEISE